jgi:hypothetical protein
MRQFEELEVGGGDSEQLLVLLAESEMVVSGDTDLEAAHAPSKRMQFHVDRWKPVREQVRNTERSVFHRELG